MDPDGSKRCTNKINQQEDNYAYPNHCNIRCKQRP